MTNLNKIGVLILSTLIVVIGVYYLYASQNRLNNLVRQDTTTAESKPQDKIVVSGKDIAVFVEIADTNAKIQRGLSYRESLDQDTGMLFDLGYEDTYPSFWMKGMHFPLDIIWIDDFTVVDIHENVPNHDLAIDENELPLYTPEHPIDMVLEVNAGFVQEKGIEVGDSLELITVQ